MPRNNSLATGLVFATTCILAWSSVPTLAQDPKLEDKGTERTIAGYVRDAACLMRHPDVLKPINECALMCARAGSPLIIATSDGQLYLPISANIPDRTQRDQLMPLVGKYVRARGRVFQRSGMQAIAIERIEAGGEPNR